MKHGKSRWPVLAIALLLAAGACSKKSSSNSGGGAAPAPGAGDGGGGGVTPAGPNYAGTWQFVTWANTGDYTCDTAAHHPKGTAQVDAAGNFSFGRDNDPNVIYSGRIDPATGQVTYSVSGLGTCGPQSGSGACSSETGCSGTYTANGYSGDWEMVKQ